MVSMATLNVYPVVEVLDCNEILRPFLLFFKKKLAVLYIRPTDISQTVDFFNSKLSNASLWVNRSLYMTKELVSIKTECWEIFDHFGKSENST